MASHFFQLNIFACLLSGQRGIDIYVQNKTTARTKPPQHFLMEQFNGVVLTFDFH